MISQTENSLQSRNHTTVPPQWRFNSPPETSVTIDADVLALRSPLVRVRRDDGGQWYFTGPVEAGGKHSAQRTTLLSVVTAWPHVSALSTLESGTAMVWSWKQHGWAGTECTCGECQAPVAADLDKTSWPTGLRPDELVTVESTALNGQVVLTDLLATPQGSIALGPGQHQRTEDAVTRVALANVLRRWPHTVRAFQALQPGRGMRWNPENLNWQEYVLN